MAATFGALVESVLPIPQHDSQPVILSYILWGIGIPLSILVLALCSRRLTIYKIPPCEIIVSVLRPFGPLAMASYV